MPAYLFEFEDDEGDMQGFCLFASSAEKAQELLRLMPKATFEGELEEASLLNLDRPDYLN